jgi:hypothetical protein
MQRVVAHRPAREQALADRLAAQANNIQVTVILRNPQKSSGYGAFWPFEEL